ncbi:MAG: flippase [Minisyncoccia bacterium]
MKKIINLFFNNISLTQIITKNSFWIIGGKLLGGILRALLVIFSARILGPDLYGGFSLAMNFVLIFSFLPELGLTAILTRDLSKKESDKEKVFNGIFSLSILISLFSYLLILFLGKIFIKYEISLKILPILGIMMIFDVLREFSYSVYRAELKGELHGIFHFLTNLILFIIGVYSLYRFRSPIYLSYAYFVGVGLGCILSFSFLGKYIKNFRFLFNLKLYKDFFNSSWPIALANALYLLLLFIDSIILGWFFPSYYVGLYTSSVKVNEFLVVIPSGISLAILPMISKNLNNKDRIKKILELGFKLTFIIILPIIFAVFVLANNMISFIFGPKYILGSYALKILIPSLLPITIFMIFSQFLIAIDRRKELIIYDFLAFFINFVVNLFIIPKFDYIGAAYTTSLSNFLLFLFGFYVVKRYVDFELWSFSYKPLIASLIMVIFIIFLKNLQILLISFLGALIYLIVLFLLKEEILQKLYYNLIK